MLRVLGLLLPCWLLANIGSAADSPRSIRLHVDASDPGRNIFHIEEIIPVSPGALTLVYPKWIPGNHRPSGPIENLTGLRFKAGERSLVWQRDAVDMYAFHLQIPAGVDQITAAFDVLTNTGSAGASGSAASTQLLDLNWNQVVLYPAVGPDKLRVLPSVELLSPWKAATALSSKGESVLGRTLNAGYEEVPLTTLIDSPLIAGQHFRKVDLGNSDGIPHSLDMVGESDAALQISDEDVKAYKNLVAETGVLFGARHYRHYDFLLTLSNEAGHHGLEHHESSDNSAGETTLVDADRGLLEAGLLPHEFVHSWNGKYRRPAGLATPDYQQPMIGDLLWVYEGLTTYLGNILTVRTGLWTPEQYREQLAETAAAMDHTAGRSWRPLVDTAISVQILRLLGPEWEKWRRDLDYYPEGELIWLEVDARIRELTNNQHSLDDFCRLFLGGQNSPPMVVPYTFEDVVKALNQVAAYDWATLLKERVNAIQPRAPLEGLARSGWKLTYTDQPNRFVATSEKVSEHTNLFFSLGFSLKKDGEFMDVIPGSASYEAGIGAGMQLVAVNGRRWSRELLHDAIRQAQTTHRPIELLVENKQFYTAYNVPYYEGEKNPHLERAGGADLLTEIVKPRAR